jgi:hypothetical protein
MAFPQTLYKVNKGSGIKVIGENFLGYLRLLLSNETRLGVVGRQSN